LSVRPTRAGYLETPTMFNVKKRRLCLEIRDEVINPLVLQSIWMKC